MRNSGSISIKETIQPVPRKHGVSRPSIYAWTGESLRYLEQALKPGKQGPKCKKEKVDAKDKVIEK
jgi:hypothetical protein